MNREICPSCYGMLAPDPERLATDARGVIHDRSCWRLTDALRHPYDHPIERHSKYRVWGRRNSWHKTSA